MNREPLTARAFAEEDELEIPCYGNFYLMFVEKPGNIHRERQALQRLKKEHPALEKMVTEKITEAFRRIGHAESSAEALRPHKLDLYLAYMVMREYVESDEELFR